MSRRAVLFLTVSLTYVIGLAPGVASTGAETLIVAAAEDTQPCPECGYGNKADLNYCIKCGARLKELTPDEKIYCPQCGAENLEVAKFCNKCGYSLKPKRSDVGATSAPPAPTTAVYFTGGLASYSDIELITKIELSGQNRWYERMGGSWALGGGFILPLWTRPGVVRLSLELSSDASSCIINKDLEIDYLEKVGYKTRLIAIRETALFGVGVGPRKMIKPFCGFGNGVGILMWEFRDVDHEATLDEGTSFKAVLDIPFGCEFHLTSRFALGVRADYLIIPGDIEMEWEHFRIDYIVNASVPDVFLLGGTARFCF